MAFGNPYGEIWKWEDVEFWAKDFRKLALKNILLSDTTGSWRCRKISHLFLKKFQQSFLKLILVHIFITDMRTVT